MWDVLSWIAFAEPRPRADMDWRGGLHAPMGTLVRWSNLGGANARAASEPYCTWQPLELDGQPWDGVSCRSPRLVDERA